MRRTNIFKTVFTLFSAVLFTTALSAADDPGYEEGRGGVVAVFPYFTADGTAAESEYAVFMVPDMIKIKLSESARFILLDPVELENAVTNLTLKNEYYREEASCLAAARAAGTDYYIRGYLYSAGEDLSVVHTVVSTAEGRVLHMEKQKLPRNRELVELLEKSSELFADWINRKLPDPEPDVVVIERETVIEVPVEQEEVNFTLTTGAAYRFYLSESAQYLRPNLGADIEFLFSLPSWRYSSVGFRLAFDLLNQKESFYQSSNQDITVLHMPIMLSGRLSLPVLPFLAVDGGLDLGGAMIFGFVQPEVIANFRPSVAADAGLLFFPDSMVSIGIYGAGAASFYVHGDLLLLSAAPSVKINFNF